MTLCWSIQGWWTSDKKWIPPWMLYFVHRFNHLLPYNKPREQDQLNDEFLEFQMMEEEDIPASIWGEAVIRTN
ncbi:unnamed protein product [Gadus morhua 'NCC']